MDPNIEQLLNVLRDDSSDRAELVLSMNKSIPSIILKSYESKDDLVDHLLLLLYNLNTKTETKYDKISHNNRAVILKQLLRHYTNHVDNPDADQMQTLARMVSHVSYSSELLIELAQVFNHYRDVDSEASKKALVEIRDTATVNLYPDALLMVHSVGPIL